MTQPEKLRETEAANTQCIVMGKFSFLVTKMLFQFTKKIITSLVVSNFIRLDHSSLSLSLSLALNWFSDFKTKSWKDAKFTPQLVDMSAVTPLKASRKVLNILIHQFFFTASIILDCNVLAVLCHNYTLGCY